METKRDLNIDAIKGISILCIIIGHVHLSNWLPTWSVALFFVTAGYFAKPKTPIYFLKSSFKRLLLPYIYCSVIIVILAYLLEKQTTFFLYSALFGSGTISCFKDSYFWNVYRIGPIWFLPALFIARTTFNFLLQHTSSNRIYVYSVIISILVYYFSHFVTLPLSINQGLVALPFYASGYITKKYKILDIDNIYLLFLGVLSFIAFNYSEFGLAGMIFDNLYVNIGFGFFMIYPFFYCFNRIKDNNIMKKALIWIGENSLLLLAVHGIDFIFRISFSIIPQTNLMYSILSMIFVPIFDCTCVIVVAQVTIFFKGAYHKIRNNKE